MTYRPVALKRLHPALGEFVIQYAVVQGTLRTLLLALLDVKHNGGGTLIYGMGDDIVLKKLKPSLVKHGKDYSKFNKALEHLRDIAKFRNQLLHWVPNINPSRTTIEAFVDAFKDYATPNELQIQCTPKEIRYLTQWLQVFEGDLAAVLMALGNDENFDKELCRTIQAGQEPRLPKSGYPAKKRTVASARRPSK
jgi:hypothetical protein